MIRVVVADITDNSGRDLSVEKSILGPDIELVLHSCNGNEKLLISGCLDADVVLTDYAPLTRMVIEQLERCQLISVSATGYSCVDVEAAADANISVCAIDEYCTEEVADHAILLMLVLCRRLTEYHDQVQRENLWQFDSLSGLARMRDMTLGIVGFGKIGQAVARRARGGLVDEVALAEALDTGQISGAGLDVLSDESPDLRTSKFTGRSNVILTPHIAF